MKKVPKDRVYRGRYFEGLKKAAKLLIFFRIQSI